jgi:hypothetical protein
MMRFQQRSWLAGYLQALQVWLQHSYGSHHHDQAPHCPPLIHQNQQQLTVLGCLLQGFLGTCLMEPAVRGRGALSQIAWWHPLCVVCWRMSRGGLAS